MGFTYQTAIEPLFEDVSVHFAQSWTGVVGPNGTGKTTLLKTINHLLLPRKGEVFLEGLSLNAMELKEIARKMSMVGQDTTLSFSLTVLDLVLLGRFPHLSRFKKETRSDCNWTGC